MGKGDGKGGIYLNPSYVEREGMERESESMHGHGRIGRGNDLREEVLA